MQNLPGNSGSVNPSAHLNYSKNENPSHAQLETVGARKPDLTVAYVPENFALADDRFHINDGSWCVSAPLTTDKVYGVIERIGNRPNFGSITVAIKGGAA
jgi:hypothetical protein